MRLLESYVGLRFRTRYADSDEHHLWLDITGVNGDRLVGKLQSGQEVQLSSRAIDQQYVQVFTTTADMEGEAG